MKDAPLIEFLALIMLFTALNNLMPILQVGLLRLREVKPLIPGHQPETSTSRI